MSRTTLALIALLTAQVAVFVAYVAAQPDPSLRPDAYRPGDNRAHRLGDLSFTATEQLIADLRQRRDAADPAQRAALSVRLADLSMQRHLPDVALREIEEAQRSTPDQAPILARSAMINHRLGRAAAAREALRKAQQLDPQAPVVQRAAALLAEEVPGT